MINQTSYERFGSDLYISAENVVVKMLLLMFKLHKQALKNPDNVYSYQNDYNSKVNKIAEKFESDWQNWVNESLALAYYMGLKQASNQLSQLGLNTTITKNINSNVGTLMLKNINIGGGGGSIPQKVANMFSKYPNHASMYNAFKTAVSNNLQNQKFQIIRKSKDIFREIAIMAGEKHYKDADIFTRRRLSQYMLNEYAKRGIQTITYKNGAKYSIDSYCEMVGRAMSGRAAVQASLNRFYESGYTLIVVSSHFRACDLCTPYEGVTLSMEQHPVYESVADAELQGLFHARCAHDVSVWYEGKSDEMPRVDSGEQQLIDRYGYEEAQKMAYDAQQKQRYIERNIRNWKRRSSVALSDTDKKKYNAKVREWQKKQRNHLNENTFLPRKYSREQIDRAY